MIDALTAPRSLVARTRAPGWWPRAGRRSVLAVAVVAGLVAAATATGYVKDPVSVLDPGAWLVRGKDLVHASAAAQMADWLIPDALGAGDGARTAQDGDRVVVVDPGTGRAFTIDPVNLEASPAKQVDASAVPFVRGGAVYLVSDDVVRWLDPATLEQRAMVPIPGAAQATIDADGVLWVVTPRDGRLRRIHDGRVEQELPLAGAGHGMDVTLAGGEPVVVDRDDHTVTWVDRRTGEAARPVQLPSAGLLQGDSVDGSRVWLTDGARERVIGVDRDGGALPVDIGHRPLLTPEVVGGDVYAFAADGTVTVVDAEHGTPRRTTPIDAARDGDFATFVKDGRLWYSAPARRDSGNVGADGSVTPVQEDRAALVARNREAPRPNEVTLPPAPTPPPGAPPRPPTGPPPPSRPRDDHTPPPPAAPAPAPTTTTTTKPPPQAVAVPEVRGIDPDNACRKLADAGFGCRKRDTGRFAQYRVVDTQDPAAGARALPGTEVVVNHTEAGVAVPEVLNLTKDQACRKLSDAGLNCNPVPGVSPEAVPPGSVYAYTDQMGYVGAGQTITVTYDTVEWLPLVQCDDPTSWQLTVNTHTGCPAGWHETNLGWVAKTQSHLTVPLYKFTPSGAGTNVSDYVWTDPAKNQYYNDPAVIGYVYPSTIHGTSQLTTFVHNSDRYYSFDRNDPTGQMYLTGSSIFTGPVWSSWPR